MVGPYPANAKHWDACRGGEDDAEARIQELGAGGVIMDPVYGKEKDAPVMQARDL